MKHYEMVEWVDYARGMTKDAERAAMAGHLAAGCAECLNVVAFCERLSSVCADLALAETPEWLAARARAICPTLVRERAKRAFRIPVELIFDSFLVPSPVGLRASWQIGWQALYRAGDCSLDVRIEPDLRSSRAALIGQLSNHVSPETQMGGIAVLLKSGKQVVAETRSNSFGEFQMEYEQQKRLQLCIRLDGGARSIVAPLRGIAGGKLAGTSRRVLGAAGGRKAGPRDGGKAS